MLNVLSGSIFHMCLNSVDVKSRCLERPPVYRPHRKCGFPHPVWGLLPTPVLLVFRPPGVLDGRLSCHAHGFASDGAFVPIAVDSDEPEVLAILISSVFA